MLATRHHLGLIKLKARLRQELDVVFHQEELLLECDRNTTKFHLSIVVN